MKIEKNVDDVELEKGHVYVFRDSFFFSIFIKIRGSWFVFENSELREEGLSFENFLLIQNSCPSEWNDFYTFNLENSDED